MAEPEHKETQRTRPVQASPPHPTNVFYWVPFPSYLICWCKDRFMQDKKKEKDFVDYFPPGKQLASCSHSWVLKPNEWFIAELWTSTVHGHQAIHLHHTDTDSLILTLMYGHKISTHFKQNPQIQQEQTRTEAISTESCCSEWTTAEVLLRSQFLCNFNSNVLRWLDKIFECSAKGLVSRLIPLSDHSRIKYLFEILKHKVLILLLLAGG